MVTDTTEKAFQEDIISHLVSTSGYKSRGTKDFNKASCLDVALVLKFIHDTQEKSIKKLKRIYKDKAEEKLLIRLVKEINRVGTINILRNGFKESGITFKLFYPKPNNKKNPDYFELYEKNIFSVIDELEYEDREKGNRVDLAIFVNGLPIITVELKDTFQQGVENAIKQYKEDRNPAQAIFRNCIVHFAMSDEKIYMTTKLDGLKTRFLPFNKGLENPTPRSENDYKTSYLYQEVLQKVQLSNLINNFIYMKIDKNTKEEFPIFPRFHQLECVNELLEESKPGTNYLIQHSAGSGKTNTIAWLSHGLINKFNRLDNRVYDMVIVVSDRKVIDRQLQEQVKEIEKTKGVVEKIEKKSSQLTDALESGSNIVVTTIQKFPHVLNQIGKIKSRRYAIIIDEAHSSQSGENSKALKKVLNVKSLSEAEILDEEEFDKLDEEILIDCEAAKNKGNISFFAFTATPKAKTIEMFGTEDKNGRLDAFHKYTMKQAIEEGFIIDVLKNYTNYETYFKLIKKVSEDPEYEEKKAKLLLKDYVEKHPATIDKKTRIMLSHFENNIMRKIKGKSKAMIVTRSRLHAVLYRLAFDRIIKDWGIKTKALIAFTGTVENEGKEYTENSMNNLPSKMTIEKAFDTNDYRLLIVANKFQTGFDQPLLHTMYVDKRLNGITAVQTLSRLNRTRKDKEDTFVMDFANEADIIQKSFKPYYEETYLNERTDYHKLYELQEKLMEYHIYSMDEVDTFVKSRMKNAKQAKLHQLLHPVIEQYNAKSKEDKVGFKKTLRRFQNIYSFLSQIMPFSDIDLEKLFIYNKFLSKRLPTINNPLPLSVYDDVDIDSYKIKKKREGQIDLLGDGKLNPSSSNATNYKEDAYEQLSSILDKLNQAYGTDFSEDDKLFVNRVGNKIMENKDFMDHLKVNGRENMKVIFDRYFNDTIGEILEDNVKLYKKIIVNEKVKENLKSLLFDKIYAEFEKGTKDKPKKKEKGLHLLL